MIHQEVLKKILVGPVGELLDKYFVTVMMNAFVFFPNLFAKAFEDIINRFLDRIQTKSQDISTSLAGTSTNSTGTSLASSSTTDSSA